MKLKIIIKKDKVSDQNKISLWIQVKEEIKQDLKQIIDFFNKDIKITTKRRFCKCYKIESDKPAIIISFLSTLQEIIPEIYFATEGPLTVS